MINILLFLSILSQFQEELEKRQDKGNFWWELRACSYYEEFEKPKIIYPIIAKKPEFAFDTEGYFGNDKTFIIPISTKWLIGLLNSSISTFFFASVASALRGDFFEFRSIYVGQFPIATPNPEQRTQIESLVEKQLSKGQMCRKPQVGRLRLTECL